MKKEAKRLLFLFITPFLDEQGKNKSAPNDHPIIESTFALNYLSIL